MLGFSQFYILSQRGDVIVNRSYRNDVKSSSQDIFFRLVKFWDESETKSNIIKQGPPIFQAEGINFLHLKKNDLYFVITTKFNVSGAYVLELLYRTSNILEDYCGILSEISLRKNFVLVYELLDEIIDYGFPMVTDSEDLKIHIHNKPRSVVSGQPRTSSGGKTTSSLSVHKSIMSSTSTSKKNEIFVDIIEKLIVAYNYDGFILHSEINGKIQLKNFLYGTPKLRLALNDDIHRNDCNFHSSVDLTEFDSQRVIGIDPPEGEFVVMNYRLVTDFFPPFRISPTVFYSSDTEMHVEIVVSTDLPEQKFASNFKLIFPLRNAKNVASASVRKGEFNEKDGALVWGVKKVVSGEELNFSASISLNDPLIGKKQDGPIRLEFEIPMYNVSHLKVRYLKIEGTSGEIFRWVRYMTLAESYTARVPY